MTRVVISQRVAELERAKLLEMDGFEFITVTSVSPTNEIPEFHGNELVSRSTSTYSSLPKNKRNKYGSPYGYQRGRN